MAISNIKLASEQGVDYGRLQDLLSQQQWKAANQETTKVLIRATRQPSDALLDGTMIPRLPCTDLNTIDQLWRVASDSHFGLSVQHKIWRNLGQKTDWDAYCQVGEQLGWRSNNSWLNYWQLTLDLSAPAGHLPFSHRWFLAMMQRLEDCRLGD